MATGMDDVVRQLLGEDAHMVKPIWTVDLEKGSTARSMPKGIGAVGPGCYRLRLERVQL